MIQFITTLKKFATKGEKTGWTYIEITAALVKKLLPPNNVSFRVKGTLDAHVFEKTALLPMGEGVFILPFNANMRKATGKKHGDKLKVTMEIDNRELQLSRDLIISLGDDPIALTNFKKLPKSHQNYFSKWIESAKTMQTRTKRIVMTVVAMSKNQGYSEMMREAKEKLY